MIEVTPLEAVEKIKSEELVSVSWMTDGCPNCEHFEEVLDSISQDLTEWNFYKIDVPYNSKDLIFEPNMFPANFIFKNGVRKVVAIGVSPREEVTKTYNEIREGIFKTDEQIEKEQLDALDEQE